MLLGSLDKTEEDVKSNIKVLSKACGKAERSISTSGRMARKSGMIRAAKGTTLFLMSTSFTNRVNPLSPNTPTI